MNKLIDPSLLPPLRRQTKLLQSLLVDHNYPDGLHHLVWGTSENGRNPDQEIQLSDLPTISPSSPCRKTHTHTHTPPAIVSEINRRIDHVSNHWPVSQDSWQVYVADQKLEICCGTAPFIAARASAGAIAVTERGGFLDRKLQVVSRFCEDIDTWLKWARIAYQSSYGYELCGDQLFMGRENLLYTFVDFWNYKFPDLGIDLRRQLSSEQQTLLQDIANIISWNLFQMDGLTYLSPSSRHAVPARITDWQTSEILEFAQLTRSKKLTPPDCHGAL